MATKAKSRVKTKTNAKKAGSAKPSATKVALSAAAAKGRAKYEQSGAPWWKKIPLPQPK